MRNHHSYLAISAVALFLTTQTIYACTDIRITANDGTELIGRTMEFSLQLNSDLVSMPRGTVFTTIAPDSKPAMTWKSKYGYLLVDGLKQIYTIDGMNEHGLAFEYLYLPGDTQYQTVPTGRNNQAIPYLYFGDWVLGNFKTVDEVRHALENVYVYEQTLPATGKKIFPLHAAIHDASGKGIVVEFVKGEMQIHDYIGVMTNSPPYAWHTTHLTQFLNLSPYNPKPIIINDVSYAVNGEGAGMLGLPGDISPSSRFVKMAFLRQYAYPVDNAAGALNLAQHILNNVDIPAGITRAKIEGKDAYETTQWSVYKDLTHKIFYYHTYQDTTVRSVDLKEINFSESTPQLIMPMESAPYIVDMTSKFKLATKNE
ncbi:MAG TPA: choloylglycine hydrolase family protein [Gammaproteobacteria bacterium]|nr:choloylglycine hydrolase family protein [Gammaproteobacteria bacterium]